MLKKEKEVILIKAQIYKHTNLLVGGTVIIGTAATIYITALATAKSIKTIDGINLTPKEKIKRCWKYWVPTGISAATTVAGVMLLHNTQNKKQQILNALLTTSQTNLTLLKDATLKTIGEKQYSAVKDTLNQKIVSDNPPEKSLLLMEGSNDSVCYDKMTGRKFRCNIETIKQKINILNERLVTGDRVSLNELYYELNLENVNMGDFMGWHIDHGLIDMKFDAMLYEGQPIIVLDYTVNEVYFN